MDNKTQSISKVLLYFLLDKHCVGDLAPKLDKLKLFGTYKLRFISHASKDVMAHFIIFIITWSVDRFTP